MSDSPATATGASAGTDEAEVTETATADEQPFDRQCVADVGTGSHGPDGRSRH